MAEIITFGCRLNSFESEVMRLNADRAGLDNTIIINSCAVTGEAERQARQAIRKAKKANPSARIIVTGCAAQIHPDKFAAMPEVDHILGNQEKLDQAQFQRLSEKNAPRLAIGDIMQIKETAVHLIAGFAERARAFVEVQQGCDHRCTFCIIPFGRGNSRSSGIGAVAEQVRRLVEQGYPEVVLTGVDITSYGHDLPGQPRLGQLVRRLLQAVPELRRLRLSSLDVAEIDEDLIRLFADEPRLMPHCHLSLQAGDDLILKRMKRRHDRGQAIALAARLREVRPDIALGADFIVGFPTETEDMFMRTMDLVEECGLVYLHVFPFSPRAGTPAQKMPQVPGGERRTRAKRLRVLGDQKRLEYFSGRVGGQAELLIERSVEGDVSGHDQFFAPIRALRDGKPGEIIKVAVTSVGHEGLVAA